MKIGLIGAGRWGGVHKDALDKLGVPIAGVLVSSTASAERVQTNWQLPVTTDIQHFLSWDMDAVIVVSPNYLHAQHSLAALEAGKQVLVEKPMALTADDCTAMISAAKAQSLVLAIGLEMRVFSLFARVKDLLAEDVLGAPLHVQLDLTRRPYRAGAGGWKTDPTKLGNAILEEPVHYLDLARWYLEPHGEPTHLQAWANSRNGREMFNENLDIRLEYTSGAYAFVTRSIAAFEHAVRLRIVTERGSLLAHWYGNMDADTNPTVSLRYHDGSELHVPDIDNQTGHAFDVPKQTEAFLAAIRGERKPLVNGTDGRAAVILCNAVVQSLDARNSVIPLG
ncbi:MAG: Gfo/Idh/MocA family oxidoreductase [Deinococcota bacterium]